MSDPTISMRWGQALGWINWAGVPEPEIHEANEKWGVRSKAKSIDKVKDGLRLHAARQKPEDLVSWQPPSWRPSPRKSGGRPGGGARVSAPAPVRPPPPAPRPPADEIRAASSLPRSSILSEREVDELLESLPAEPAAAPAARRMPTADQLRAARGGVPAVGRQVSQEEDDMAGKPIYAKDGDRIWVVDEITKSPRTPTGAEALAIREGGGTDLTGVIQIPQSAPTIHVTQPPPSTPPVQPTPVDDTDTWACSKGHKVPDVENFCPECGDARYWSCDNCVEDLNPAARKACRSCGTLRVATTANPGGGPSTPTLRKRQSSGGGNPVKRFFDKIDETLGFKPKSDDR